LTVACQASLPRDSPGKNTGVGCHALLQGIFPDPEVEPASPAAPEFLSICLPLSCQGSPYTHHYIKNRHLIINCHLGQGTLLNTP